VNIYSIQGENNDQRAAFHTRSQNSYPIHTHTVSGPIGAVGIPVHWNAYGRMYYMDSSMDGVKHHPRPRGNFFKEPFTLITSDLSK
jgi:hypothetical protein